MGIGAHWMPRFAKMRLSVPNVTLWSRGFQLKAGVALLTPFFWRADIAEGRLVRLFSHEVETGLGHWLVYPDHRRNLPKVRRFREWLLAEISRDQAMLAASF
jgi:DNA-binding transcriptional LysR family regulator